MIKKMTMATSGIKRSIKYLIIIMISFYFLAAQPEPTPSPFVCDGEAYTVRSDPGKLYKIDQSVAPFVFTQIGSVLEGPFGEDGTLIRIQVNNIGYRVVDNMLYGVALASPTRPNHNYGLVKIDSLGNVFSVPTSFGDSDKDISDVQKRFLAGDIDPNTDKMYLNTYPTTSPMYVVDLSTLTVTEKALFLSGRIINVADWAVNPLDGKLYGADGRCNPEAQIYQLDPMTGIINNLGNPDGLFGPLPCSNSGNAQYYAGAWFNVQGELFIYRNNDYIYKIDISQSPPILIDVQQGGAGSSAFNDAAACLAGVPLIDKFYTFANNNWELRCANEFCTEYRLPNIGLDNDIFADPLPQNWMGQFVLLGKQTRRKTVINPGQYIAVSNIKVLVSQDIWFKEDFSDCTGIGAIKPARVPGGVQVVLITKDGDVKAIDGELARGIGGSIELTSDYALVHVENVPANSVLRIMVKFHPHDNLGMIGMTCTNHGIILHEEMQEIVRGSAELTIEAK
jgi:hypothetical protein